MSVHDEETKRSSRFPLPMWLLALVALGLGGGGAVGFKGLTSSETTERIRALEVREEVIREELKAIRDEARAINVKMDQLLGLRPR